MMEGIKKYEKKKRNTSRKETIGTCGTIEQAFYPNKIKHQRFHPIEGS